ncbi:hypothetical protein DL98DRAFT_626083 [Cadophora sp. DSE1049]|nr:hypothetical protein DL98DRAFT_626083 [Cadophora sp. DSE1049]
MAQHGEVFSSEVRCSGGTFFPKITLKVFEFVANYEKLAPHILQFPPSSQVSLTGTVKIHGVHLDLVIHSDNTVRLQSRYASNIGLENDVYGFAKQMLPRQEEIADLRARYISRYKELNPNTEISLEAPLIIAGEWIGRGINKGVAVCELPNCFVIISVCVNYKWIPDEPYSMISNEAAGIYNISRGGFYKATIDIASEKTLATSMEILQSHNLAVEGNCPFARALGIIGAGEGIVWKAEHPLSENSRLWFKTKGPLYNSRRRIEKLQSDNPRVLVKVLAEDFVTEARLDQAFYYLLETSIVPNQQSETEFLSWLLGDVEAEERNEITEMKIDLGLLRAEVRRIGHEWFSEKLIRLSKALNNTEG